MATENFFNINDLDQGIMRKLAEGVTTRVFVGEKAMLSVARLAPNASGQVHSHPEEQWGICIEGSCVRIQDGKEHPVKAGDFWCTPGGVPHDIRAGAQGATVIDVFSPPRQEYTKPGEGFGTG